MPINIPKDLPAYGILQDEGVMVMDESVALRQDIRPLEIGILNLMPKKIETETQFARVIASTPLQINLSLIRPSEHRTKTTSANHMEEFYDPFNAIRDRKFDGLIVTGAPIEHLDFEQVTYWDEMTEIIEWTQTNVHFVFGVCWGAMAMLWHWHGIEKRMLNKKAFGCYRHKNLCPSSPYLRGFSDDFVIPVSRWTEVHRDQVAANQGLKVLLDSDDVGPCLIEDKEHRALHIFNHFEYDSGTLDAEYKRDLLTDSPIEMPVNYYPNNDMAHAPRNRWRSHGHLLYGNWINEIYQSVPFEMNQIGAV